MLHGALKHKVKSGENRETLLGRPIESIPGVEVAPSGGRRRQRQLRQQIGATGVRARLCGSVFLVHESRNAGRKPEKETN